MRAILSIVFVLTWGIASAAKLPFVEEALQGEAALESTQPEPADLAPDWWRFFDVEGEKLEQHIKTALERLDTLLEEIPPTIATAARPHVGLIRANLQALLKAKAQPSPKPPAPPTYAESYAVSQLLMIAAQRRKTQIELQTEQEDVAALVKAVKAANRRLDTLVAAYLQLAPSDPTRVLRGLEIIAQRSSIAVTEERLRVRKAAILADEILLKQLASRQAIAAKRLVAEPGSLERLAQEIEKAKVALDQDQNQFINAQARVLGVVGEDPEDKATAQYRQQLVVRAGVAEGISTIRLIEVRAEYYLVALLLDKKDIDARALYMQLAQWDKQLDNIRQRAIAWRSGSERERDRAGDLVAGVPSDSTGDAPGKFRLFLMQINQDRLNLAQETLVALHRLDSEAAEASMLIELVDAYLLAKQGRLRAWLAWGEHVLKQLWDEATRSVSVSLFRLGDTPVTTLGLLRVVLIITIAWWISHGLRRALKRLGERGEGENLPAFYTVGRLSHYVIIAIGFMVGLSSIGLDFTNFALFAGAIAIGIGFGLQSIVNNFVSGLIILFDRSLKVGDFVELASGVAGEVREIKVRSTVINTNDNVDIVVPNSEFMNTQVINWTLLEAYRRIHIPFKVAYGTSKELVRKAGLEAAEKLPHTLLGVPGRNPGVWLVRFGESGLDFELVVWVTPRAVKRPGAVHAAYMWEIETALRRHGVEIPIPQRDLRFRDGFEGAAQPRSELASNLATPRLKKT